MFTRDQIPAVGASIGIERVFPLFEKEIGTTTRESLTRLELHQLLLIIQLKD
jgi:histidyl-tRNA synthetase